MPTPKEIVATIEEVCGPLVDAHYAELDYPYFRVFVTDHLNRHEYAQRFSAYGGRHFVDNIEWKPLEDKEEYHWEENFPHPVPDWVTDTLNRAFTTFCMLV